MTTGRFKTVKAAELKKDDIYLNFYKKWVKISYVGDSGVGDMILRWDDGDEYTDPVAEFLVLIPETEALSFEEFVEKYHADMEISCKEDVIMEYKLQTKNSITDEYKGYLLGLNFRPPVDLGEVEKDFYAKFTHQINKETPSKTIPEWDVFNSDAHPTDVLDYFAPYLHPKLDEDKLIEVITESLKRSIHKQLCEEASAEIIATAIITAYDKKQINK